MTDITLTQLPLKPGTWALDTAHARVGFAIRHLGVAKVRGFFADVDATLTIGA
ncbi:MAG TPA: YceI family protein, partial [Desertimonas sp.]|nr:YceI family protein [Desertimonas sp.]